jgi:hypothetical protein
MRAEDHYNVTRGICCRGEDDASFEAPCKDVDEARDESSEATKAQIVGEATEAQSDV